MTQDALIKGSISANVCLKQVDDFGIRRATAIGDNRPRKRIMLAANAKKPRTSMSKQGPLSPFVSKLKPPTQGKILQGQGHVCIARIVP